MKALVLNALGHGFDVEDVEIDDARGRQVLLDVQGSGPESREAGYFVKPTAHKYDPDAR